MGVTMNPDYQSELPFQLFEYFFNSSTPNLASGVPVLAPFPSCLILDAFIVVEQAFNGTTPKADVGFLSTEDNIQTISESGPPTSGNFTATYGGVTSGNIPYNTSAANLQTILQGLSSIGAGNVTCAGGPLPATPIVCTFGGALADADVGLISVNSSGLTGGTASVAVGSAGIFALLSTGAQPVSLSSVSPTFGPTFKGLSDENIKLEVMNPQPTNAAGNPIPLEMQLIVNQTGAPGGAASGSTQGAAKLFIAVAQPLSLNPTDPPLPL